MIMGLFLHFQYYSLLILNGCPNRLEAFLGNGDATNQTSPLSSRENLQIWKVLFDLSLFVVSTLQIPLVLFFN